MKIAMIAPPWLPIPPDGYGGIESVVHGLVLELAAAGHEVELFVAEDAGGLDGSGIMVHESIGAGRYDVIHGPLYDTVSIPVAHQLHALSRIAGRGFDVIHDHNAFVGLSACAYLDPTLFPPVLHTLHGPFTPHEATHAGAPDNRDAYRWLTGSRRLWLNGISRSQLQGAPAELVPRVAGVVHNGLDIGAEAATMLGVAPTEARQHFVMMARICRDKGQALGAQLCADAGARLVIAGAVEDDAYFDADVRPWLTAGQIEYVGELAGTAKVTALRTARALLMPIDWEEPFGFAVIEALALGTPVVAMRRGAMPEIIEDGVNGFLVDTPQEFAAAMERVAQIDPAACVRSVCERFSARAMADGYLRLYDQIIDDVARDGRGDDPRWLLRQGALSAPRSDRDPAVVH